LYDTGLNKKHVNIETSRDTTEFACDSVAHGILSIAAPDVVNAFLAAGADIDHVSPGDVSVRQVMADEFSWSVDAAAVDRARRRIARLRLDFVRYRALEICIGLQERGLDALQTCEILLHACGPVAPLIRFHHWWKIATTVKHFSRRVRACS